MNSYLKQKHTINTVTMGFYEPLKKSTSRIQVVLKLVEHYGRPDLKRGNKNAPYKDYILFDNINQIFTSQGTVLIREIYEALNSLLSSDPNYLHQRAKCYIRAAINTADLEVKRKWFMKAQRDAASSYKIFEERYAESLNEKVQISADHTLYTVALTLCHIAKLSEYKDVKINEMAVETLDLAIASPYNSVSYIKKDKAYNYNDVVGNTISTLAADTSLLQSEKSIYAIGEYFREVPSVERQNNRALAFSSTLYIWYFPFEQSRAAVPYM